MKPVRFRAVRGLFSCLFPLLVISAKTLTQDTTGPSNQPAHAPSDKAKKVWTNDDIAEAGTANAGVRSSDAKPAKANNSDSRLTETLRAKIQKLEAQLKATEAQLTELKKFAAGETDGSTSRDMHRGINRIPVPEQIQKLEAKRSELQAQIGAIYDEARQRNIPPGELR